MGFSTGKKLLVTKRNMRSGSGALSTWGTNLRQIPTHLEANSPTAMSPRMNSSENITATGLGRFVQNLNKTGDLHFL